MINKISRFEIKGFNNKIKQKYMILCIQNSTNMKDDLTIYINYCVLFNKTPNYSIDDNLIIENIFDNNTRLEIKPINIKLKNNYKLICKNSNKSNLLKGTMKEDIIKYILTCIKNNKLQSFPKFKGLLDD